MRTKEQLNSKEFQDDMRPLSNLLIIENIKHTFERHKEADPKVKEIIGYYPTGEWHIRVGDNSIIRGMASFGDYEIFNDKIDSDPEKFETAQEVLEEIKNRLNK